MNTAAIGGLLGMVGGSGLLLAVLASPPLRRITISDRIAPYLRDVTEPHRLVGDALSMPPGTLRRLIAPVLHDAAHVLMKVAGGNASVRRRLAAVGSLSTPEQFRMEQVVWAACGMAVGLAAAALAFVSDHRSPLVLFGLVLAGAIGGVLARDWRLSALVGKHHAETLAEFPVVAEMLALAVAAGEGPAAAIARVSRLTRGHLSVRLGRILADTRAGATLQTALLSARDATDLEPLARFLDGMAVAIERGTPMAGVLRAQAADVRALGKRRLLEAGGKKEILMMVPVVFLILPITILFAFFPGLIAITTVAQ